MSKQITVNQIVVKGKEGRVGVAHYVNGEIGAYEAVDLGFKIGEKNSTMANITWEVASLLKEAATTYLAGGDARLIIAVPESVSKICNNIDLLTRMLWTNNYILDKSTKKRQLTTNERKMYKEILMSYRLLIGKVVFQDSYYTKKSHEENETSIQGIWADLNPLAGGMCGIEKKGPEENVAETPVVYNTEEEKDMPF